MLKTYLYVPDELNKKIIAIAQSQKKSKAEIMRAALEEGVMAIYQQGNASAQALLKIREIGRKNNLRGPRDGSTNMDEYLWGKDWSKDE